MGELRRRVVVKFRRTVDLPYADGIETEIVARQIGPWGEVVSRFPNITLRRMVSVLSPSRLRLLEERAARLDPSYEPGGILRCFRVDVPSGQSPQGLGAAFRGWANVETAYVEAAPVGPPAVVGDFAAQDHHQGATAGIGTSLVWLLPGADGEGIRFAVIDQGTPGNGVEIPPHTAVGASQSSADDDHVARALTIVAGVDNKIGGIGIVPNAGPVHVITEFPPPTGDFDRVKAIYLAIDSLGFGDVLLLESQGTTCTNWIVNVLNEQQCQNEVKAPVEIEEGVYLAIRLASALGIIVIEPTGNGSQNLDALPDLDGKIRLEKSSPDYRDSGAIMVAGAQPGNGGWICEANSSHGKRVNCFARAVNVTCTDASGATLPNFGGTSAASAIVAGAAIALQGMAWKQLDLRLSPFQMRTLLSDANLNTPKSVNELKSIGVMPNLVNLAAALGTAVDLYARDHVGDDGSATAGTAFRSPDIILLPAPVADGQVAFGETSGTANNDALSTPVVAGTIPAVYVRVRNRGAAPATNATVRVRWSPPSSLVTPASWQEVGTASLASVPNDNQLKVFPRIDWSSGTPSPGHYCLVATIGCDEDPEPPELEFSDFGYFVRFVRENNNVVWRNISVVAPSVMAAAGPSERRAPSERNERRGDKSRRAEYRLPFEVAGAPDRRARMRLEVVGNLPSGSGAKATLTMPDEFVRVLRGRQGGLKRDARSRKSTLALDTDGPTNVGEFVLDAGKRVPLELKVVAPAPKGRATIEFFARQIFDGVEVGRVTWRLAGAARRRSKGTSSKKTRRPTSPGRPRRPKARARKR